MIMNIRVDLWLIVLLAKLVYTLLGLLVVSRVVFNRSSFPINTGYREVYHSHFRNNIFTTCAYTTKHSLQTNLSPSLRGQLYQFSIF